MKSQLWIVVAVIAISGSSLLINAEEPPEAKQSDTDPSRIAMLIEQLGSSEFDEREAAARTLRGIGKPVRSHLFDARNHKSPEVRRRAAMLLRQLDIVPLEEAFQEFARQADDKLDLEEGMWLISRILNKDAQRIPMARQLDALADAIRKKLGEGVEPKLVDPERLVTAVREVIFEDQKFAGNFEDYGNPANSSLEKVLETKKGLPILLSHVVVAVARRLDVPIVGIPTAGRYIVKYDGSRAPKGYPQQDIFFNPFQNGAVMDREERMRQFPGTDPDKMVPPQSARYDLVRMLINLESQLFDRDETDLAFQAVAFRVALQQNDRGQTD